MGSLHQRVLLVFVTNTTGKEKNVQSLSWRTESPAADQQPASPSRCIRFLQVMPVPAQEMICGAAPPSAACIQPVCDNKLSPAHPVWKRASQIVSPGSPVGEVLPRKKFPKSTHARRRPGERALSDKHKLCDRKFTFPRRRPRGNTHASTSYPVRFPRTLGKHSSDTLKGPSENPLQTPSKDPREALSSGPTGPITRRTAEAANTALSRGGERVLRDTLVAPRGQGHKGT